jgi:hypothetical protein
MKRDTLLRDQLYSEDVFQVLLNYEIIRNIRYPTPLALIHLEMTTSSSNGETPPSAPFLFETILNSRLRAADIPARHGKGYLILLPETDEAGARAICERLLIAFDKEFQTQEGKRVKFLLYMGIAAQSGGPTLMKDVLLQNATLSLQQSRSRGANTIGAK